jgi:hypothetical protein
MATVVLEVSASYLFLWLGGLIGALDYPAIAWLIYANSLPSNNTKLLLGLSAAPPFAIMLTIAVMALRQWLKPTRRTEAKDKPLYGNARVANERDLTSNNFVVK